MSTARLKTEAEHPHEGDVGGDQRGERDRHDQRRRGDHPPGAQRPGRRTRRCRRGRGATRARTPGSARPGTPRSPWTTRTRCRTAAPECWRPGCRSGRPQPAEMAVLEDPHHRTERRGQREDVQQHRLDRKHHAAGQQEQQDQGDHRDQSEHQGSREVIAWTLSRLVCAVPANSTARPPGGAIACRGVQLAVRAVGEQRRDAVDGQQGGSGLGAGGGGRRPDERAVDVGSARRRHRRDVGHRDSRSAYIEMARSSSPVESGIRICTASRSCW